MRAYLKKFPDNLAKKIATRCSNWRLSLLLVVCVLLGGTSQNVLTLKIPLYSISILFIGHALFTRKCNLRSIFSPTVSLGGGLLALYFIYIIPTPPSFWANLSGREMVVESFALTNSPLPWLPLSLSPRQSLESLFSFLPVLAIALIMRLSATHLEIQNAEKSIIVSGVLSCLIGYVEVLSGIHIYKAYELYSVGFPVGVFTNINHQATLSAIALPLATYFLLRRSHRIDVNKARTFLGALAVILLILSLMLTRSSSGYFFLVLNTCLALIIMADQKFSLTRFVYPAIGLFVIIITSAVILDGQLQDLLAKISSQSETSRRQIFPTSIEAAKSLGIFGAGPGSFDTIYRIFENHEAIKNVYVNEAHNEYIQLWIELGIFGVLWLVAALLWLTLKVKSLFFSATRPIKLHYIYFLSILTVIIHSAVDFPLRTIGLSALFSFLVIRFDEFGRKMPDKEL